tara:strand:- start:1641 stop:1937 length:297 start_codon:yes stop_codon:yes gene_type:complete
VPYFTIDRQQVSCQTIKMQAMQAMQASRCEPMRADAMQNAERRTQDALQPMRCRTQNAECRMQDAMQPMQDAADAMQASRCRMPFSVFVFTNAKTAHR